jgi:diguanylate cyclase (GGDEF)-like protein/PAS domain S-box-containing protein
LRLAHLDRSVNSIGASGDRSARVAVSGSDELAELARAINRMLQAVEHSHGVAQEATTRYQQLFEEVQTGVLVVDALSHLIVDANSAAVRMLGTTKDDIVGSPCQRFCPEESTPATTGKSGQQLTNTEGVLIAANGERIPIMRAETSIKLAGQTRLLESIVDISAQKQHETWLTNLAYNDPLTGVSNRRTLEENLERAIDCAKSGIPSALMQIDLDRFKQVNDVMGHDAGDQVLILLTAIMKLHLRSSDILARMGGDEFAILMQQTKLECAREVAERVRRKVEEATIVVNDVGLRLTISVGVVAVDGELPVREQLVRADAAMYAAKRLGRNRTEVSRIPPPAPN